MSNTVREQLGGGVFPAVVPPGWAPDPCPDLTPAQVPWGDRKPREAPWRTDISAAPVDVERTKALARKDIDSKIDLGVPNGVSEGAVAGMPLQIPGPDARAQLVLDRGREPVVTSWHVDFWWGNQHIQWFPKTWAQPIEAITLPSPTRREGDPQGAWDRHAYILRPEARRLVELIQLDHVAMAGAEWTVGWSGGGSGMAIWDLDKVWTAAGQPSGICAASIPQAVHFYRYDEILRGVVDHAAFFALPRYNPGFTGYARHSDGKDATIPLRCGERIRLTQAALERIIAKHGPKSMEAIIAVGLRKHGAILGDTGSTPTFAATQDPRWIRNGWKGLGTSLSDFEVVDQQFALVA